MITIHGDWGQSLPGPKHVNGTAANHLPQLTPNQQTQRRIVTEREWREAACRFLAACFWHNRATKTIQELADEFMRLSVADSDSKS